MTSSKFIDFLKQQLPYIALLLLAVCLLGFNHVLEIRAAEGRRAIVTFEMTQNDNWIVPYQYGYLYYNKPPFYNWVIGSSFNFFGTINEFALRFPGVLSLLLTAFIIYFIGKDYLNKHVALLGAGIFLTMADLLFYGSINAGEIDLFYTFVVIAQISSIFYFFQKKKWFWLFFVSYFFVTIGLLSKGLPSLAFQGLTLLAYFIYKKEFKRLFHWSHFAAIFMMLGLTVAYFAAYSEYGDALGYAVNIFKQASQRSANESSLLKTISQLLIFPPMFLSKLLPWSLAILLLIYKPIRAALIRNEWTLFLIIFIIVNIPIYWTAPDIRIRYTYMFFPVLGVLFAQILHLGIKEAPKMSEVITKVFQGASIIVGVCLLILALPITELEINYRIILAVLGLLVLAASWFYVKCDEKQLSFWWLILIIGFVRLGYNLVGMPYTRSQLTDFREEVKEIVEIADGAPVHHYDELMILSPDISFFGNELYRTDLTITDDQTSSFGYYYALYTNNVMDVSPKIETGHYYLLFEVDYNERLEILKRYENMIGGKTMYFCRAN